MKALESIDYRQEFLEEIGSLDDYAVRPLEDYGQEFVVGLGNSSENLGHQLPWSKTAGFFRLRTSEVTIWAGYNGSGKSALLGQAMTQLARDGVRILVASFEMPIKRLQERHCAQIHGRPLKDKGEENLFWEIMELTKGNYWVYDQGARMDPERVLGMISYAAREYGIKHFVIDSLVKCGVPRRPDHGENLERFLDVMQILAKRYDIAIHLVMHLRKPDDHSYIPTKYDIKYAGEITDLADNVVLVWRNKAKELGLPAPTQLDTLLIVDKQRHFSWEGTIGLEFDDMAMRWS